MQHIRVILFDALGTLFDTASAIPTIEALYPGEGEAVHRLWQQKQLEHAWALSMQGFFVNHETVGALALDAALRQLDLDPRPARQADLASVNSYLTPFADSGPALQRFYHAGFRLAILSNGTLGQLHSLVWHAGLDGIFELYAAEVAGKYKPHPDVYQMALDRLWVERFQVLYVSAHEWDIAGAATFGFPVAWVNRSGAVYEGLSPVPHWKGASLTDLTDSLLGASVAGAEARQA